MCRPGALRSRSLLALSLMVAQAFFHNAILFTSALVLGTFHGVAPGQTGLYLFPFAIGSFIGPLEIRGFAIAIVSAAGTLVGGVGAPALYGALIGAGSREPLFWGYVAGGIPMVAAAGVEAEGRSLEDIPTPLSARQGT